MVVLIYNFSFEVISGNLFSGTLLYSPGIYLF